MPTLLQLSLGPVQGFILEARRTRDLWFGSHVLSELARAGARSLANSGWTLIFPYLPAGDPELETCYEMWREPAVGQTEPKPPLTIVNKLLAYGDGDPAPATKAARQEMRLVWGEFARRAHGRAVSGLRAEATAPVLQASLDDLLEVYAAWVPYGAGRTYAEARRLVDVETAARKGIKDFDAWPGTPGLPKSSLDGLRETVLKGPAQRGTAARIGRVARTEQLDAIGVVKRFGGEPDQFPPISRIAVQSWVAAARTQRTEPLFWAVEQIAAPILGRIDKWSAKWIERFAYDGGVFFRDRWTSDEDLEGLNTGPVETLLRTVGEPEPYVACLVADGDAMGSALGAILETGAHQEFSARLAGFAQQARGVVESYGGSQVYSGGDDVVGFLPVGGALGAARALAQSFAKSPVEGGLGLTLSVGVAIGHVLTPMGELLALGRKAERLAKGDSLPDSRNALAVILEKRGGAQVRFRQRWSPVDPVATLENLRDRIGSKISSGFLYEVRDLCRRVGGLPAPDEADILTTQVKRAAGRRQLTLTMLGLSDPTTVGEVQSWVDAALLARHLARDHAAISKAREAAA